MPIEFKCSQCGRLLRTGDETAGRMAQCPQCGSQTQIPQPSQPPATPPAAEIPTLQADDSPFGGSGSIPPLGGSPFNSQAGPNPYQQSSHYHAENAGYAKSRVSGPAIGLIVTAALGMLANIVLLVLTLVIQAQVPAAMAAQPPMFPNNAQNAPQMPNIMPNFGFGFDVAFRAIGIGMAVLVLIGGIKMNKLENFPLAMAASIVALIPCISPCCLIGLPMGIWALVVLNDANVKIAFK